jgi:hypothetical protein
VPDVNVIPERARDPMNIPKIALLVVIGMMIFVASFYLSLTILTLLD